MNREIKFRAYLKDRPMEYFGLHNGFPANWSGWNTVMQYTGLKDKNGKEIYSGDIVKIFNRGEWIIVDQIGGWGIKKPQWGEKRSQSLLSFVDSVEEDMILSNYEIIGNIYESK